MEDLGAGARSKPARRRPPRSLVPEPVHVPRFSELGAMPIADPLAMNYYMHRALGVACAQTMHDPDLDEEQRRSRLCELSGRMAALTPLSRIYGAEAALRGEARELADGNGPEMEKSANVPQAAVDSTSGRGTPRRGRPRKRGMR